MKKIFYWRFSRKIEGEFWIFYKRFPWKKIKWKKFLLRFLLKIEAGGKILKGFPFKFTTCLVLHVLHFIWNFFYNPRTSLARAAFKRDFLVKLKPISFFWSKLRKVKFKGISLKSGYLQNFLWSPLSTSYPRACEVKCKWKWSESESEVNVNEFLVLYIFSI